MAMAHTTSTASRTSISSVTLEVADLAAARRFSTALGVDTRGLAKDLGVPADGTGSHRIVLGNAAEPFTDPDGFAWETTASPTPAPSPSPALS